MKDLRNYPLLAHNTFGMDVRASRFVEYASEGASLVLDAAP